MAFNSSRWVRQTLAYNSGAVVVDGPATENGPALFTYQSGSDNIAAVSAANYFSDAVFDLAVGDIIMANASDGSNMLKVSALDRDLKTVSTVSFTPAGSVGTANIQDGAVTAPKLASDSVETAKIAALAVTAAKLAADSVETAKIAALAVTNAKIAAGAVNSAKLDASTIQYAVVSVNAASFLGAYATPVQLVAAPGANKQIVLHGASFFLDYGTTQFAAGGAVHIQYDNTANGAGVQASGTIAAAGINAATADSTFQLSGTQAVGLASATVNKGLFLSNATAAFTTGDSVFKVAVWYSVGDYA